MEFYWEFSCFGDGVHAQQPSPGEATPAYRRRNQKFLCGAIPMHQKFVLARRRAQERASVARMSKAVSREVREWSWMSLSLMRATGCLKN